jgi:hypothetical protein
MLPFKTQYYVCGKSQLGTHIKTPSVAFNVANFSDNAHAIRMAAKWGLIVAVKHFWH